MKLRETLSALACCAFLLLSASAASAFCVCSVSPSPLTPEEARAELVKDFNGAAAVFSGRVVRMDVERVTFRVENVWKGEVGDELTMLTGRTVSEDGFYVTSSCDYHFRKGERYLVYAYGAKGELKTHACSRTRTLSRDDDEARDEKAIGELDSIWPHEKRNPAEEKKKP